MENKRQSLSINTTEAAVQRLEQCVLHSPDDVQHQNSMAEALEQLGVRWEDEKKNKWTTRLQTSALVRKGFCKFFFGIDLNSGINGQGSKLIHPNSPFINGVNTISIFVLFYILIVVQVEIGFYWMKSPCYLLPTYHFDMAIDVWFIFEMVLSFFTGMYVQGVYNDSFRNVARAYLRGTFLFDCLTAVPVSIIDYALRQQYCVMGMTADGLQELVLANEPPDLSWLRIFKPLRLVKLTRLLKTLPMVLVLIDAVEKLLRIPVFLSRLFRLLVAIIFTVHTVSCLFWLVKESSARDMVEVESWLLANGLPVDAPLLDKYMVAAYFITTVFTTVGFGDIAAENTQERVFSIAAMYVGVVVFGTLLSEVQNAIGDMFEYQRQRVRMVQQLKDFLYVNGVEHSLADLILSWVEFDFSYRQEQALQQVTVRHVPEVLRRSLVSHLHGDVLYKIPFLRHMSSNYREDLLVDLFARMQPVTFPPGFAIANAAMDSDRLYLLKYGIVKMSLPDGSTLGTLNPGDFFGENGLLGEATWRNSAGMTVEYHALAPVWCMVLSRQIFVEVVDEYPTCVHEDIAAEIKKLRATRAIQHKRRRIFLAPLASASVCRLGRWFALASKIIRVLKCPPDDLATSKRVVKRALKYMSASFDAGGGKVERSSMDACEVASVSRSSLRLPDSEASGRQQEGIQAILEQDDANCDANVDPNSPVTSYYQQLKSGAVVPQGNELPDLDTLTGVPFGVTRLGGEEPDEGLDALASVQVAGGGGGGRAGVKFKKQTGSTPTLPDGTHKQLPGALKGRPYSGSLFRDNSSSRRSSAGHSPVGLRDSFQGDVGGLSPGELAQRLAALETKCESQHAEVCHEILRVAHT